jgi:hypothetical protein
MFVLTFESGVYCLTGDREVAESWAELGDGFNVTELDPDDFTHVNEVTDILEEYEPA